MPGHSGMSAADQDAGLGELGQKLAEARGRCAAAREILRVMSASSTDAKAVLDAFAAWAPHLCHGHRSAVYRCDGTLIQNSANQPRTAAGLGAYPRPPSAKTPVAAVALDGRAMRVPDMNAVVLPERFGLLQRAAGEFGGDPADAGAFLEAHAHLLETFPDRAPIARPAAGRSRGQRYRGRCRRGAHGRRCGARRLLGDGGRQGARQSPVRLGRDLRGIPPGRGLEHQDGGWHRLGIGGRRAYRRVARRADLAHRRGRRGSDVPCNLPVRAA
jgi:hypothetical protein